jgi:nicotinamidase-related amidase
MNSKSKIIPKETAILCMDYQKDIVNSYAAKQESLLRQAAKVLDVCRQNEVLVIYVVVQFRNGYPEIGSQNKTFAGVSKTGRFVIGSSGTEVHESVSPKDDDIIVTKRRVSGFAGSDLDLFCELVRSKDWCSLVLPPVGLCFQHCAKWLIWTMSVWYLRTYVPTKMPKFINV